MAPRRIFLLTTVMTTGGVQKAMMQLARGLADRGHDIAVATMYDKSGAIPRYREEFGLPIIDLAMNPPGSRLMKALAMIRGTFRLRRLLRHGDVQVLQSFTHYSNILGPVAGATAGVPVRVTSQRTTLEDRSPWLRRADRLVSRIGLAHRMVAVSESLRGYCIDREGLSPDRVVTVPNGVDIARWNSDEAAGPTRTETRRALGLQPEHLAVITVARLAPPKGIEVLLEAVAGIVARKPMARFLWVGDGEQRDELTHEIRARGLEAQVHLLGSRRDVPALLRASDLFVLPSLSEGMPNAVLEAMAAALAVVATAVDGTPEVVAEGRTGWLVPPGNPDALVAAIDEALDDPDRRARLGEAGRRRVETTFSLDRYVDGFEALYEELLAGRKAHG